MHRLVRFELGKIWRKRSFFLSACVLLVLNVFLLWYTNLSDDETPELYSYKTFQAEIDGMTESEKAAFISDLKETIDGICFAQEILSMQSLSGEMGTALAEQSMQAHPGKFEKYYDLYKSGNYLKLTNSLNQETALINELYAEWKKVVEYDKYLKSVQENRTILSNISIFGTQNEDTFSSRNIDKSADDYASLSDDNIRWMPSKALTHSMESSHTDILLILSAFLFIGNLIFEEKEKKLFYITRSTRYGIVQNISAKIISLLINCMAMALLLYTTNIVFFEQTVGFGDITANIQSVAPYMESNLSISILEYILLSIFTKGCALFAIGVILTALCILADNILLPYITGILLCGISYVLYLVIPAVSTGSMYKYINLIGILKTENIYGAYLNFNVFEYPVSRLSLSWIVIVMLAVIGILACVLFFMHGENFELKIKRTHIHLPFKPHSCLLRHESHKIIITNRAAIIILIFGLLISYRILSQDYYPSMQEQYYKDIMMQLEGELTDEKEALIISEKTRYDEAFANIEEINQMVSQRELSEDAGEALKSKWYTVTAFYPSFERVLLQYERICEKGGSFIYDTGYLYLFDTRNQDFLIDLLLLTLCVILAFSNVVPMEYQCGSWSLLGATMHGKRKIILRKALVCVMAAALLSIIPFVCRIISISSVYPIHGLDFSVHDIPYCQVFPLPISVSAFILLLMLSQAVSVMAVTLAVLGISYWRKNNVQTIFFAILILAIPLVLELLGFSFAGWFSIYPFYSWTTNL
ncbi:MAG: hypothetical protein IJF37_05875 [Lachnospiraceae bacterium]|nr:hypothetical protein [Lachnospiraceae bacterium]